MFRRLRLRLTAVCTVVTALVVIVMSWISLRSSERLLERQSEERFSSSLNNIYFYIQGQSALDHAWLSQTEAEGGLIIYIQDNGRAIFYNQNDPAREALVRHTQRVALEEYRFSLARPSTGSLTPESVLFRTEHEGQRYQAAVSTVYTTKGRINVTLLKPTVGEAAEIFQLRLRFGAAVFGSILCLLVFAWLFTGLAVRPIEQSRREQDEFVSAASHELRSPLAVMQASAGAMRTADEEQRDRFARTIEGECQRLSSLVGDLLSLAGADSHQWSVSRAVTEPETVLLAVSERFEALAANSGIALSVHLPDDPLPRCWWDPNRIEQLLSILVDNAISYTPSGGSVVVGAGENKRRVILWVEDTGPGIPDEDKERIFRRFYRGDPSRRKKGHYGLGLSIAQELARLHKGKLTVEDAPDRGARFVLALPVGDARTRG